MEQLSIIINDYLEKLSKDHAIAIATGNATPELSFRPTLDVFLSNISSYFDKDIQKISEPRTQGKSGRPDWMFCNANTMGVYGYVEAKEFNPNTVLNPKDYESQVKRYLYLGNPVILTDGIDFIMYQADGTSQTVSLCSKPIRWDAVQPNSDILPMFQRFFKEEGFRTITERKLVEELSGRAKHLCEDLEYILSLEEDEAEDQTERHTIIALKHLWTIASKNHDKTLQNNHTFAGFVAQILSFALLYAHRFVNEKDISPKEKYVRLHSFWTTAAFRQDALRLSPFKTLLYALSNELNSKFSKLGIWYDNTRRLLSCIRLSERQVSTPNYHALYEAFLKEYDGKTRNDFGAWYTPMPLAEYAVNFVKKVLPSIIPGESVDGKAIKVIDPCCGTGTFIEAVVRNLDLHEGSQIIGFEILPVPYALSNYRISMLEGVENCDIEIVLTNTLSDSTFKPVKIEGGASDAVSMIFRKEQKKAMNFSRPPLTVIIGNPPCSDSKDVANEGKLIAKLMDVFRPSERTGRRNDQKQLTNKMTKFLRWCLYKAEQSRPSVFALVLPSTFANNVSFVAARKFLIGKVSEMWVLEFDVDKRAGHKAENLFNTLQGRLLLVGTLKEIDTVLPIIHYKSIINLSYNEKLGFLNSPVDYSSWDKLKIGNRYTLKPTGEVDEELYSRFWHIASDTEPAIFMHHCSGHKLAPTHLLVHFNKGQLRRRCKFIGDENNSYSEVVDRWFNGQKMIPAQEKLSREVRQCLAESDLKMADYSFRPFLTAHWIVDDRLMSALRKTKGGGMRLRPELQAAFSDESVFAFAIAKRPADISTSLKKFTSFCWYNPDNDLVARGDSFVLCNKYPGYKKSRKNWIPQAKNNINDSLLSKLSAEFNCPKDSLVDNVVFYSYAILSSDLFLNTFEGLLFTTTGELPSIPVTKDKSLFEQMTNVGKEMAKVERKEYTSTSSPIDSRTYLGAELKMDSYIIKSDSILLLDSLGHSIEVLIPKEVLQFDVSGYNIIRQWLKYHQYAYYRKYCSKEEFDDLSNLVGRILDFKDLVLSADAVMKEVLNSEFIEP